MRWMQDSLRSLVKIDRMGGFECAQAFSQFAEAGWKASAVAGKNNAVFAFVGIDGNDFSVKSLADSVDVIVAFGVVCTQVAHQNSAIAQTRATGIIEGAAAQLPWLSAAIKTVDQQHVKRFVFAAHEVSAIGTDYPETGIVGGDAKLRAQGDDFGGQLNCGEVTVG